MLSNILIADDHFLVIDGLEALLRTVNSVGVIYKAKDSETLFRMLGENKIDVVFLDVNFGNVDGRELLFSIRKEFSFIKVIALTSYGDTATIRSCVQVGFDAFLLKSDGREEIVLALTSVSAGAKYYSTKSKMAVFDNEIAGHKSKLSEREMEIIKLIASEKTNKEIAQELFISEKTVENHRSNIMLKMDVKNVAGLVKKAMLQGIIQE